MSRKEQIQSALTTVYGNRPMVEALSETIDEKWDGWLAGEGEARYRGGLRYALHMEIWHWFSGGGTAEHAADKVISAVDSPAEIG